MADPADPEELAQLATELAAAMQARGLMLVTAESCTGGWVAKLCTDVPGSSGWFRGGAVAYHNELKVGLLDVNPATLEREGAVSEAVVRQMAVGALARLGGDVAVAVSGIAGPDGGSADKPVGTVWLAWARREATGMAVRSRLQLFEGDREAVRRQAVRGALEGVLAT